MKIEEMFSEGVMPLTEGQVVHLELADELISEGVVSTREEATELLESNLSKTIRDYASRYSSKNPPEIMAYQDPEIRSHIVVLAAGDNMFFRFDVMNGRIVSEERYSSFKELMDERELLKASRYYAFDHKTWLQKNWKKIMMGLTVGSTIFLGGPLIVAFLTGAGPFLAWASNVIVGIGALTAAGWVLKKIGDRR